VVCLEPDTFACFLFARHMKEAPLDTHPQLEFIADDHLVHHPERLPRLLETLPDSAILFSNILGQLRVLLGVEDSRAPEFERIKSAIAESITGRSFASFHDRVSGCLRPAQEYPVTCQTRMTDQEVLDEFYDAPRPAAKSRKVELVDHLTQGLLPEDLPHSYFAWEIEAGRFHIIEAVAAVTEPSAQPK
jgi:hypothetical protein